MSEIKQQPITSKSTVLSDWLEEIVTGKERKKIEVGYIGHDTDLPVFHLPDGNIYIGFTPPTPCDYGYGVWYD